ncbi:O-succinylbenzoic acid--CoA ligase [Microbispora rosea subsp. aerata]|nr:AMP-binding protein [Microbispora rosea]GGO10476.1 O-succinylbenzoic acid--CoA ligase [Microbispora rosea subsp. aerata]GIH53714.1 O-succinylbenzoic acid--CoA ligase [Microbispora rosea subsp. aerata]GLJ81707.1 O-succinylbenzoic acid--CoA ligase [Microbispora rosea subsp. aerata]
MHALVLPPGPALSEAVRRALTGDGPAALPLSPDLPRPALEAALAALRPTHVVTPDGVRREPDGVPSDAALIIATSGSTGAPKGVELTAGALLASARASLARLGAGEGDRWLCCLPPSHISGAQVLIRSLLCGTEPIVHPRFSPADVIASGADYVSLVPTQLRRVLDTGADLAGFPVILLGGAAAPPALLAEARAAGLRVVTTYGMSETSGGCVYDGVPLDGVEVEIGDDGRVRIAGPVLFSGYRLRAERPFEGGWFVTSDLGSMDDGRLTVLGRADDVINTGGRKVVAGAVADVLAGHPAVRDVVVVGRPDPEWGEIVVAVVVPRGDGEVTLGALRDFAKERLPAYAAPRAVELVSRIPLLPNGKPDMVALKNQDWKKRD